MKKHRLIYLLIPVIFLFTCGYILEDDLFNGNNGDDFTIELVTPGDGSKVDSLSQIEITYSADAAGGDTAGNYSFSGSGSGSLSITSVTGISGTEYRLHISGTPGDGTVILTVNNVADEDGNELADNTVNYTGWWDTDWVYRRRLTFDNSSQSEDLDNFPVLVRLSSSNISYNSTQNNGEDIRFLDPDRSNLSYEIEEWNESGESVVWVKVPRINGSSASDFIWMYYGNSSASDSQDASGVWDSNFIGVWHLSEQSGNHSDSAGNLSDGTRTGNTYTAGGYIDGAQSFNGSNQYITNGDVDAMDSPGTFSASFWFYRNSDVNSATNHNVENVVIGQSSNSTNDNFEIGSDGTDIDLYVDTGGTDNFTFNAGITDNTWYYLTLTYDQSDTNELKLYLADSLITEWGTSSGPLADSSTSQLTFGIARPDGSFWGDFDGIIDEVRLSSIARSADWVAAQYSSLTDSFITYSAQE